ncbi:TPA: DUF7706 family protein [Klebsiella oxytoca]|uniref:DUF7706 family protein n=1 Tax=Klebsiella pasteurii TaxID=2587529 RepID=UPI0011589265|nr:hypothetical protein [Klebsiella pasteurii]VUS40009.1 hypothetical protein SB6417_05325 [Klebsiella pasteurii]
MLDTLNNLQLSKEEALALAQLLKQLTWADIRGCAADNNEAYTISDAVAKLQKSLAEAGYQPRYATSIIEPTLLTK